MFRASSGFRLVSSFLVATFFGLGSFVVAQDANKEQGVSASPQGQENPKADPLKRPIGEKQKKENAKSLKQELGKTYKKWLDEDVRWIITDE